MVQWSILPLFLKIIADELDVITICWYRLIIAFLVLTPYLRIRRTLPNVGQLSGRQWALFLVATLLLTGNYVLYLKGLHLTSPSNGQVIIQLGPLFLSVGGLCFYGEKYNRLQWLGVGLLTAGLCLFFRDQLSIMIDQATNYLTGSFLILLAAVTWAGYALVQKRLNTVFSSPQTMWLLYLGGIILLLPIVEATAFRHLSPLGWTMLTLAGLNTLFAYGTFSESLSHWDASRISAVLALSPLVTVAVTEYGTIFFPNHVAQESISVLGLVGAVIVVIGSMFTALSKSVTRPR